MQDTRRQLDQSQRQLDNLQSKYSAQSKTKEASSLREDAFQLFEARRAYLKSSMDFSIAAPQLRMALDRLLVKIHFDQWRDVRNARDYTSGNITKCSTDLERIRGWSRDMESGERAFRRELQSARKQLEETAENAARPSRELEDYSAQSSSVVSNKGSVASNNSTTKSKPLRSEKQGWLNLRTITGKPTRTVWVRRWFFVKNGIFGWLVQGTRSGGVEESEKIGVLLCGVKAAPSEERRFCWEVKTKDTTIVLQADSRLELMDWLATFDVAKQKALEDPVGSDMLLAEGSQIIDPAFAVSSPSAPEFAASASDAGMQQATDEYATIGYDRPATLPVPGSDAGTSGHRSSFDPTTHRRSTALEREGESGREHAARIIQKLDLHRKSAVGSQVTTNAPVIATPTSSSASGGIASLISASHTALPLGSSALTQPSHSDTQGIRNFSGTSLRNLPTSTLAPSTLANPPTPTNLSAAAVIVNGERGIGVGKADNTGGMPSGMMANLWGSSNWGYINRLERGEVKPFTDSGNSSYPPSPAVQASLAQKSGLGSDQLRKTSLFDREKVANVLREPSPSHRKTISLDGDAADLQRAVVAPPQDYPNYYPVQLKTQDAQFRLLFPNVRKEERVVLVFRATWNPNDAQEFPGRVYVTIRDIYFYSHHLGLVLITGLGLNSISEVTAAPGRDCDFIFLHLKQNDEKVDFTRITIKTFLEPLKLLQRRLNFLVQNCDSDEPRDIEAVMKNLIKLEHDDGPKSPSLESWEDGPGTPTEAMHRSDSQRGPRDLRASVLIDQGLFGQGQRYDRGREVTRFKLPSKPVEYVPRGVSTVAVEKLFDISPKALFHVMFGDRSAVWQLLYHERQAYRIKQGPWIQEEKNHMRRVFEYNTEYLTTFRRSNTATVVDTQMIDVMNDHLCYVVTDRKTPWYLPCSNNFMLVSKVVITHVAKSKCKLAIYTNVEWSRLPLISRSVIEKKALSDLQLDALDLADVITEQVRKLGAQSRTKKAIQIFGAIGAQKQITEFGVSEPRTGSQSRRSRGRTTLPHLFLESVGSMVGGMISSIIMWFLSTVRWAWKICNANSILLVILGLSIAANLFYSSLHTSEWWRERRAGKFMNRLGIGPDMVLSKAVTVRDLNFATSANSSLYIYPGSAW